MKPKIWTVLLAVLVAHMGRSANASVTGTISGLTPSDDGTETINANFSWSVSGTSFTVSSGDSNTYDIIRELYWIDPQGMSGYVGTRYISLSIMGPASSTGTGDMSGSKVLNKTGMWEIGCRVKYKLSSQGDDAYVDAENTHIHITVNGN